MEEQSTGDRAVFLGDDFCPEDWRRYCGWHCRLVADRIANYDGAAVQQTDEALASLRLMFSVIPGALYVLTGGLLLFYHLSDSKLETHPGRTGPKKAGRVAIFCGLLADNDRALR